MPSQPNEIQSAENRFRQAFDRLKAGKPNLLALGAPVTQNNVAREAGCDPSALKKARFPALIHQIQAYIELHPEDCNSTVKKAKRRATNRSMQARLDDAIRQHDHAQSILVSANIRILELSEEVHSLKQQLDKLLAHRSDIARFTP